MVHSVATSPVVIAKRKDFLIAIQYRDISYAGINVTLFLLEQLLVWPRRSEPPLVGSSSV